jgi:hypothetical protein
MGQRQGSDASDPNRRVFYVKGGRTMTVKSITRCAGRAKGLATASVLAFAMASGTAVAAEDDRARGSYAGYGDSSQHQRGSYGNIQRTSTAENQASAKSEGDVTRLDIAQSEPEVSVEQAEPEVSVEQAEPEVSVEQAEPKVEIDRAEDAQVRVIREGQDEDVQTVEIERGDQSQPSAAAQPQGQEMVGKTLVSRKGEQLGKVDRIVRDKQDDSLNAVIASGGFLGMGEKQVVVPLDQLQLQGDQVELTTDMNQRELEQMAGYQEENYEPIANGAGAQGRG